MRYLRSSRYNIRACACVCVFFLSLVLLRIECSTFMLKKTDGSAFNKPYLPNLLRLMEKFFKTEMTDFRSPYQSFPNFPCISLKKNKFQYENISLKFTSSLEIRLSLNDHTVQCINGTSAFVIRNLFRSNQQQCVTYLSVNYWPWNACIHFRCREMKKKSPLANNSLNKTCFRDFILPRAQHIYKKWHTYLYVYVCR